jgi:putative transposase
VIFHADRGRQYTSAQFAGLASGCQVVPSHGRTGQHWDDALAESFFSAIKGELLDDQPWPARAAARSASTDYLPGSACFS